MTASNHLRATPSTGPRKAVQARRWRSFASRRVVLMLFVWGGMVTPLVSGIGWDALEPWPPTARIGTAIGDAWWKGVAGLASHNGWIMAPIAGAVIALRTFSIRPGALARRVSHDPQPVRESTTPGIVFVDIRGLSGRMFAQARSHAVMPTVTRWLEMGTHRDVPWESDLSPHSSASQAGLLYGDDFDIPASQWFDKTSQRVVDTESANSDVADLERLAATHHGLLTGGGAHHGGVFLGGASEWSLLRSRAAAPPAAGGKHSVYFPPPYGLFRLIVMMGVELARESDVWIRHRLRRSPRDRRPLGENPVARIATTVMTRELTTYAALRDMRRGLPVIYVTTGEYDDAAGASGVESARALRALRLIDHQLRHIDDARHVAARPYEVVVFSGYGQSPSVPFRADNDQTFDEWIRQFLPETSMFVLDAPRAQRARQAVLWRDLNAFDQASSAWLIRMARLMKVDRPPDDSRAHPAREPDVTSQDHLVADVIMVISGNAASLSFPDHPQPLTLEAIQDRFPELVPGLLGHDGVAFVLARSARQGAVAVGRAGMVMLEDDHVKGENPLAGFGPHAARHLRRQSLFANNPDLVINSRYDQHSGDVIAFDDAVSCHDGLTGPRAWPFLLVPSSLPVQTNALIGASSIHAMFHAWRERLVESPPSPASSLSSDDKLEFDSRGDASRKDGRTYVS